VLVHLTDERTDLGLGELANAVAEDLLVFGECGEGWDECGGVLAHGRAPVGG
jgi:hypothetical protein